MTHIEAVEIRDTLTDASWNLFADLVKDAGNWNDQPLLDITKEERGNLTQLKRAGLLITFKDEGCDFVIFNRKGAALAKELLDITITETNIAERGDSTLTCPLTGHNGGEAELEEL